MKKIELGKAKEYYSLCRSYLQRFSKRPKKKGKPRLKIADKKTVNKIVVSGLGFVLIVGLVGGFRSITVGRKVASLEKHLVTLSTSKSGTSSNVQINDSLKNYLSDFVWNYFYVPENPDDQSEQAKKLNDYYGSQPDIQSQGQTRNQSWLDWSRLVKVKGNVATYEVHYKQKVKDGDKTSEKDIATGFNIPFAKTKHGYYVSGLPWFSSIENYQDKQVKDTAQVSLDKSDGVSDKSRKKLDRFLKVFFTNYTTDQDNLDLIASHLTMVDNTTFKSLDYSYYKASGNKVIAYAQATFEVAGSTHSENFTFTLSKKNKSYYVEDLKHTIPANYGQ